jgi:hypothetical protein
MNILKKRYFLITGLVLLGIGVALFKLSAPASALSGNEFVSGRIIDESVFFNPNTMNVGDIQAFLNSKVPVCDTGGTQQHSSGGTRAAYATSRGYPPPYICLKDYTQGIPTKAGDAYCNGTVGGGTKSAAQIIYDVSQACGVSVKALIVMLQKEQSLVTDDWPWSIQYRSAMGYGCPDTAPCDAEYYGFFNQVYNAAHQFQVYARKPQLFNYRGGATGFVQYNPNAACGGGDVYMQNQATAGLYNYTPYQPNAAALANLYGTGDGCSAYGNRNFWRMYIDWFGSTQVDLPYAWSPFSDVTYANSSRTIPYSPSPTVSIAPGGTAYVTFKAHNYGNHVWSQAEARLGTVGPKDRASIFADSSWLNPARITMQESSIAPGGTATFMFNLKAPATTGSYKECFNLVADGVAWMQGPDWCYNIDVIAAQDSNDQNITLASGQTLNADSYLMSPSAHSILMMQADGNLVLYNDSLVYWHTATGGSANHLVMQADGNLVLYDQGGNPKWWSGTGGNPGATLTLQSDGNLVIYSTASAPLWQSNTSHVPSFSNSVLHSLSNGVLYPQQSLQMANRSHTLLMQRDGNMVLYSNGNPIWTPFTQGNPGARAVMQNDGNFVIYNAQGRPLWWSGTGGNPGARIYLQDDGNVVIYSNGGVPLWQSYTLGR